MNVAESNHLNAFIITLGQNWLIQKYNYSKRCYLSSSTDDELNQEFVIHVLLIVIQYPA